MQTTITGTLADLVTREMIEHSLNFLPAKHGIQPRPPVDLGQLFDGIKIAARFDGMQHRYESHRRSVLNMSARPAMRPYFGSAIDRLVQEGTKPLSDLPNTAQWDMLFTPSLHLDMMQAYGTGEAKISAIVKIGIYMCPDTRARFSVPESTLLAEVGMDHLKNRFAYLGFAHYDKRQNCLVVVSPAYGYFSQQDIEWIKLYSARADGLWQHLAGNKAIASTLGYDRLREDPQFGAELAKCDFSVNPAEAACDINSLLRKIDVLGNSPLVPSCVAIGKGSYYIELASNSDTLLAGYFDNKIWGQTPMWIQNPHRARFESTLSEGKQGAIEIELMPK